MPEFFALFSYLLVMIITPGPNNLMLTASGANFGVRRSLPHLSGILLGNAAQFFLCSLLLAGAAGVLEPVRKPLAVLGCLYLLWIALKLARASAPGQRRIGKPVGFVGGMLFQCVNPKAWIMVLNAAVLFMPTGSQWLGALTITATAFGIGVPSLLCWVWGGDRLRRWLGKPRALAAFNLCMAGLLAGTALWLLYGELWRPAGTVA
ncbi:LysE family translocator [Pseudomonas typographi]|uniref:LysE family translocator n=1 Tax=Pseudomonas typographi TaxID=2715964 RepID=A0ABR7Z9D0_9PSED|nr:LysE family translocator [Pseudomonas typographi]MBD1551616.1 LysE family translocator [Pseudomonas typographi]MBD1587129.1 LysE family translocator [Pseudomonas typographi]MBD1602171.1 LysE family translocator [Pseudomonas typographi]